MAAFASASIAALVTSGAEPPTAAGQLPLGVTDAHAALACAMRARYARIGKRSATKGAAVDEFAIVFARVRYAVALSYICPMAARPTGLAAVCLLEKAK